MNTTEHEAQEVCEKLVGLRNRAAKLLERRTGRKPRLDDIEEFIEAAKPRKRNLDYASL
jgi:hypothetical protein